MEEEADAVPDPEFPQCLPTKRDQVVVMDHQITSIGSQMAGESWGGAKSVVDGPNRSA